MKRLLVFASVAALAAATAAAQQREYWLSPLPLQYNASQPVAARATGWGNCWAAGAGLAALFADPAELPAAPGISAEVTGSAMSAFQSHGILRTRSSSDLPGVVAAGWCVGNNTVAGGLRRAMRQRLDFPDPVRPQVQETMTMDLDQARGGWCLRIAGRFRIGVALGYDRVSLDWSDSSGQMASAKISSENYALACAAAVRRDLDFGLFYRSRSTFRASTGFRYLDTMRTLQLFGREPAVTGFTARWQPDSGLTVCGQAELTGWQTVTSGYIGTLDWHLGAELELLPRTLAVRAGASSLQTPLDQNLRQSNASLHNLTFLTAGAGVRYWRVRADIGLATSYPLSGKGLNQNIVAFTLGYSQ